MDVSKIEEVKVLFRLRQVVEGSLIRSQFSPSFQQALHLRFTGYCQDLCLNVLV